MSKDINTCNCGKSKPKERAVCDSCWEWMRGDLRGDLSKPIWSVGPPTALDHQGKKWAAIINKDGTIHGDLSKDPELIKGKEVKFTDVPNQTSTELDKALDQMKRNQHLKYIAFHNTADSVHQRILDNLNSPEEVRNTEKLFKTELIIEKKRLVERLQYIDNLLELYNDGPNQ